MLGTCYLALCTSKFYYKNILYREYVYSFAVYQKCLTRLGELIIFEPWRENYYFPEPS